jgi:hypothetical protein
VTRPNSARLVLSPLLLLVALLTTLGLNASSAAANAGPETRVRAIPTVVEISVGQQSGETAGGVGCLRPSQPGLAPGSCVATEAATSRTFGIADRVAGQLDDVRLGSLRGQLGPDDLQRLVNAPGAQRYYDTATGNINVIQQVDDVLLRITTASDEFKIISVGPIRPNQVTNGVTNGRFVPIGGAG